MKKLIIALTSSVLFFGAVNAGYSKEGAEFTNDKMQSSTVDHAATTITLSIIANGCTTSVDQTINLGQIVGTDNKNKTAEGTFTINCGKASKAEVSFSQTDVPPGYNNSSDKDGYAFLRGINPNPGQIDNNRESYAMILISDADTNIPILSESNQGNSGGTAKPLIFDSFVGGVATKKIKYIYKGVIQGGSVTDLPPDDKTDFKGKVTWNIKYIS